MRRYKRPNPPLPPGAIRLRMPRFRIVFFASGETWHVENDLLPLRRCRRCGQWLMTRQVEPHLEQEQPKEAE